MNMTKQKYASSVWPYLKKFENEILYPCCSAIPAQRIFAEAPYSVPLPVELYNMNCFD